MNTEELESNLRNSTAFYAFKATVLIHGVSQTPCPDCRIKAEDPPIPFSKKDELYIKRCPYNIIIWILNEEQEILYAEVRPNEKNKEDLKMAINAHKIPAIEESTRRVEQQSSLLIFFNKVTKHDKI